MLSLKRPEDRKVLDSLFEGDRLQIIHTLLRNKSMYLTEIARESGMDRTTLAYHLAVLEKAGIVKSEYKMLTDPKAKGKAGRFYSVNVPKLAEVIGVVDEVRELIPPHRLTTR